MSERRGFKFRLYPTVEQEALFRRTAGCCRLVYNLCLEQRVASMRRYGGTKRRWVSAFDQQAELKALKEELPFLAEVPHHALQQAIGDLHRAFGNWVDGTARFPQFRKKHRRDSFRYPDPKQFKFDVGADLPVARGKGKTAASRCRIFLPKAKWVEVVRHRPVEGRFKTATVSREADAWYVSVMAEREVDEVAPNGLAMVGVDGGVEEPLVLSTGEMIALPKTGKAERRRKKALKMQLSRQKKGSRNREKTKRKLARFEARIARRRKDAAEKASTRLAKNHGLVALEDLPLNGMTASAKGTVDEPGRNVAQKAGLNRSLLDVGLGQVYAMLERKAPAFGCRVVRVDPRFTSQTCRGCEHVARENRPTRARFRCVSCGHEAHADVNAAGNVLDRALAMERLAA
jgi:putative transposase